MKKILLSLFVFILSLPLYSQNIIATNWSSNAYAIKDKVGTGDSINIGQMVLAQINVARKKEQERELAQENSINIKAPAKKEFNEKNYLESIVALTGIPVNTLIKILIIVIVSVLLTVIIVMRRKKAKKTISNSAQNIKENISLLRQEKLIRVIPSDQNKLRKKLAKKSLAGLESEERLSNSAKELNLSKGELLLAARIKMHQDLILSKQ